MDKPINVCVLVGSLWKASLNGMLANALISLAPSSMESEVVKIGQGCVKVGQPGTVERGAR